WRIREALSGMVVFCRRVKTPSGGPCFTVASYMLRMASRQQVQAYGWGPKITALRVLMAMMHLNSTVEVGLVMGVIEKMSPIGSAPSTRPRSGNSRMTPTDGLSLT